MQHFFSIFSYSVPQLMESLLALLVPNQQDADLTATHGRASLPSPQTTVNTSDIPSGLYILRVTLTDGTVQNVKVVRK